MSEEIINNFLKMLDQGQDNALLRFSLGNAYLNDKNYDQAIEHLAHAVNHDPEYSAAWKLYGKALAGAEKNIEARSAFEHGIKSAEKKGDIQAAKEMRVFLKRLE